jgi:hypothetical protein
MTKPIFATFVVKEPKLGKKHPCLEQDSKHGPDLEEYILPRLRPRGSAMDI